jgi:hypothetical protein
MRTTSALQVTKGSVGRRDAALQRSNALLIAPPRPELGPCSSAPGISLEFLTLSKPVR